MRVSLLSLALLYVVMAGCCSRSHDFGAFVVAEVAKHGGHTKTNAVIPKLEAQWTVNRDRNGFQASVSGTSFANIDALMRQTFGTPKLSVEANASGQPHRVWGAADIGVAIQLIGRTNGADIVCVRGMQDMSGMFKEMDRPWW